MILTNWRYSVKKSIAATLIILLLAVSAGFCWADEEKDHVCFRVLDSNKDGLVSFQEFEKVYGNDETKFKEADVDKNGKLTHDEYHDILGHGSS
jgi:Ca2+-binding EF-hand superfamily protein